MFLSDGAEPTEKPKFEKIVEAMAKMGYSLKINTNGTNIDTNLAECFRKNKMNEVRISLDGSTKEINDFIRGEGSYKKIIEGIKKCVEQNLQVSVAMTFGKHNIDDISNIIDLSYSLGVCAIHSYPLVTKGRGLHLEKYIPDEKDMERVRQIFREKRLKYDCYDMNYVEKLPCKNGTSYIELSRNGDVFFHENSKDSFGQGISRLGNIFDEDIKTKIEDKTLIAKTAECKECAYYKTIMCADLDTYCFDDIKFKRRNRSG